MILRDVRTDDVDTYVRLRCDPVMMAELGGPLLAATMPAKVASDVAEVRAGTAWILMIVPQEDRPDVVAGSIALWSHPAEDEPEEADLRAPSRGSSDVAAGVSGPFDVSDIGVDRGGAVTEIGWMVLPEFQGRGLAKAAVRMALDRARAEGRWGVVNAFPGRTNGPSNGICHALGFDFVGPTSVDFADRRLAVNHWRLDPAVAGAQ